MSGSALARGYWSAGFDGRVVCGRSVRVSPGRGCMRLATWFALVLVGWVRGARGFPDQVAGQRLELGEVRGHVLAAAPGGARGRRGCRRREERSTWRATCRRQGGPTVELEAVKAATAQALRHTWCRPCGWWWTTLSSTPRGTGPQGSAGARLHVVGQRVCRPGRCRRGGSGCCVRRGTRCFSDQVSATASFFELGGNSLSGHPDWWHESVRRWGRADGSRDVFEAPTVAALTARGAASTETVLAPVTVVDPRPESLPLSFMPNSGCGSSTSSPLEEPHTTFL